VTDHEIQVDYVVNYQKVGDLTWYGFTNTSDVFEHAREYGPWNSTTDLAEAQAAAQGLIERTVFTDSRPKYQYQIAAAQVVQVISSGGVIITFGKPQEG
jgi:hypothetical protein